MQSVKIVFKSIILSKEEQLIVSEFFSQYSDLEFHYYPIFDEKEHINSVHGDINIWVVDKYEEDESDKYHCVIRYNTLDELIEEFETLTVEIAEIFMDNDESSISIKQSLTNSTNTKKYNLDRRGKGELDINYKAGVVEEDSEERERRLKNNTTGVVGLNPYKDLFK